MKVNRWTELSVNLWHPLQAQFVALVVGLTRRSNAFPPAVAVFSGWADSLLVTLVRWPQPMAIWPRHLGGRQSVVQWLICMSEVTQPRSRQSTWAIDRCPLHRTVHQRSNSAGGHSVQIDSICRPMPSINPAGFLQRWPSYRHKSK